MFLLEPVAKYWQWSANRFPCYLLSFLLSSEWYLTTLGEESCLQWRKTLKRWFLFHKSDQTDQARASKNIQTLTGFQLNVLPENSWLTNLYRQFDIKTLHLYWSLTIGCRKWTYQILSASSAIIVICVISETQLFRREIYKSFLARLVSSLPHHKVWIISVKKCALEKYFCQVFQFGTNIALYVKCSKMRLYISSRGHFKQLWERMHCI